VPEKSSIWCFLQVGACKSGGCSLLSVGAREIKELVPVNKGVVSSFPLVLDNLGSWCFLQVGASFLLVLENLEVGASYECILDIHKNTFCCFISFGFPHKLWCTVYLM
jgi:hypothetical protein